VVEAIYALSRHHQSEQCYPLIVNGKSVRTVAQSLRDFYYPHACKYATVTSLAKLALPDLASAWPSTAPFCAKSNF
jgi:hypothetical protein